MLKKRKEPEGKKKPVLPFLVFFFEKFQENPPQKQRIVIPTEPLKFLEKKGKTLKKTRNSSQGGNKKTRTGRTGKGEDFSSESKCHFRGVIFGYVLGAIPLHNRRGILSPPGAFRGLFRKWHLFSLVCCVCDLWTSVTFARVTRGGRKTLRRTPLPKRGLGRPSYGTFSTRPGVVALLFLYKNPWLSRPEALLEGSKHFREGARFGTFSSPHTFCTPPYHGPKKRKGEDFAEEKNVRRRYFRRFLRRSKIWYHFYWILEYFWISSKSLRKIAFFWEVLGSFYPLGF